MSSEPRLASEVVGRGGSFSSASSGMASSKELWPLLVAVGRVSSRDLRSGLKRRPFGGGPRGLAGRGIVSRRVRLTSGPGEELARVIVGAEKEPVDE